MSKAFELAEFLLELTGCLITQEHLDSTLIVQCSFNEVKRGSDLFLVLWIKDLFKHITTNVRILHLVSVVMPLL